MNSASLCSLAGRYPIPTRFLAPIDCLQIPAPLPSPMAGLQRQHFWTGYGEGGGEIDSWNLEGTKNGIESDRPIMLSVEPIPGILLKFWDQFWVFGEQNFLVSRKYSQYNSIKKRMSESCFTLITQNLWGNKYFWRNIYFGAVFRKSAKKSKYRPLLHVMLNVLSFSY